MEQLKEKMVANQVLAAKKHRRYPASDRPSSQDRRMIFLGVAVATGVWEIEFSTGLRKLAQAGYGLRYMTKEFHRWDRYQENLRRMGYVWAEPVGNYFFKLSNDKWELMQKLPCKVPSDWQGGYIIHGFGPSGFQSTFSRTLPQELIDSLPSEPTHPVSEKTMIVPPQKTTAPNHFMCECGTTVAAASREQALKALADHKRLVHGEHADKQEDKQE